FRKAVEAGGGGQASTGDHGGDALSACVPIIIRSAAAREAWDKLRADTEKEMARLARTLPVWPWVESVEGFGAIGLAKIVGEAGDLSNYATKERLWKRLGLAVLDGMRQGNPGKAASAEDWTAHGYNPRRRAEIWMIADSLFRA